LITTITNGNFSASINHLGAELFSFKNTDTNLEYIWDANPDFWAKHSPILFPIVGTLKNDSYQYNGANYSLSRHGFARDKMFALINKSENSVTFSIQETAESLAIYPFNFELQIKYTLELTGIQISYTVINKGNSELPFSIGAHPAFALVGDFENYSIEFEKDETLTYHLLEDNLIADTTVNLEAADKIVPLNYELFKNDALIFKKLESKSITILKNSLPYIKVKFSDFPQLGIWTKVNAPFICIEPWFGYSDTKSSSGNLFEKEGIQILAPNTQFNAAFSIEIA
jgi:galactose mutarotase-like enzyme